MDNLYLKYAELFKLYKKYNILSDGLQRRYVLNAFERRFDLDFVTPIELHAKIGTEVFCFESRSWVQLLKELVGKLYSSGKQARGTLLNYRTDWSKAPIFNDIMSTTNMIEVDNDLYFSVNYTSTHSSWIIGDLLKFYNADYAFLVVHRAPTSEPYEIKNSVREYRKLEFKDYLINTRDVLEERADKIIKSMETLNKLLVMMKTSYNDFFLFDDTGSLSNYKSKLLKEAPKLTSWTDKQLMTVKKYLDYLSDYFNAIMKASKGQSDCLVFNAENFL